MKLFTLLILLWLVTSYSYCNKPSTVKAEGLITSAKQQDQKNFLHIRSEDYTLEINNTKEIFTTASELSSTLKNLKNKLANDTLYIYIYADVENRLTPVSEILRTLNIDKFQYVVTDDLFALPYPQDSTKAKTN